MDILEIVILGLVPMLTILVAVVSFLMIDRKQLTVLISGWKDRFNKQSKLNKALKTAQATLKKDNDAKLKRLKESQGKQFKLGFSAFLENCQTEVHELLDGMEDDCEDSFYRSALQVYVTSLEATLGQFQSKSKAEYEQLMAPMREKVIDVVSDCQSGESHRVADGFQQTFKTQETDLIQLRGLIEQVYQGGQVVVKEEKDELVLVLEKQLRDRISQQREMLLQLHRLEAKASEYQESLGAIPATSATPESSATPDSTVKDWKGDMPKMIGS
ncbi:MAG: hypothetical protein ACRBBW_15460 [Cellvibrionaceae bacterium]